MTSGKKIEQNQLNITATTEKKKEETSKEQPRSPSKKNQRSTKKQNNNKEQYIKVSTDDVTVTNTAKNGSNKVL